MTADLGGVFSDPDGQPLQYLVARLGNVINPTAAQIAQHPLVDSISFAGDQLRIRLKPDQSGSVEIEIAATDGSFRVSDSFLLTVDPVPDNPIATPTVTTCRWVQSCRFLIPPTDCCETTRTLTATRSRVDLSSVTQPSLGSLEVNAEWNVHLHQPNRQCRRRRLVQLSDPGRNRPSQ